MPHVAVFVTLEIKQECVEDFLKVMEADKIGSREEAGCLRFDVLVDDEQKTLDWYREGTGPSWKQKKSCFPCVE